LQTLVTCLAHENIVSDTACSQAKVVCQAMFAVIVKTAVATWLSNSGALNNHLTAMPGLLLVTTALSMLTTVVILFNTTLAVCSPYESA
jgi:hypothetical protein